MIGRRTLLTGAAVALATPALARTQQPLSSVSILVDLSATWHNAKDDPRNLQLLGSVGHAIAGAARLIPKPMVVRYHQIGQDSLGREAICQVSYRKSLFGFAATDGVITSEHDFLQYVAVQCPQVLVHQPVQPTTEITAAVVTAMRATEMTGADIPKFLIILSDFKEESPTAYSLRDISLRGVRIVMLYRVLPEDRRRPAGLNTRLAAWRNAFTAAKARVRLFEDIAVNPADLQSVLESMI